MSTTASSPSPSRAEELLREAIEMGAEDVYLQSEGDRIKLRYRVSGRIVQKLSGFLADSDDLFDELKGLCIQEEVTVTEDEWLGTFPFSGAGRSVWIRVYWFREENEEAIVVSIIESRLGFDDLGLSERDAEKLGALIAAPQGIVIGCGADAGGHATTLNTLLERLAQNGKRVVSLGESSDTRLEKVTYLDITGEEWPEQIELLTGHFDVFALGTLDSPLKVRAAFQLAAEGHLVLGLQYSFPVYTAMSRFLHTGISPEEIEQHFLGGWSQRLVNRANQNGRIGLFHCVSSREARKQFVALQEANYPELDTQEEDALWQDAEEKIEQGLITREEAAKHLPAI
ncbi:hypothetical protein EON83_13175 [bacterium]|nr:MAG: hypothetical protein EON83_13175 [bacterium]